MLLHNIRDLPSRRNAVYVTVLTPFQSLSPLSKPEPVEILKFANVLVFAKAIFGPRTETQTLPNLGISTGSGLVAT